LSFVLCLREPAADVSNVFVHAENLVHHEDHGRVLDLALAGSSGHGAVRWDVAGAGRNAHVGYVETFCARRDRGGGNGTNSERKSRFPGRPR
jgi:hypothetical protein